MFDLKFQQCLEQAKSIVKRYRDAAPIGCDPQNTWAAIVVGVAGIGVSAYQKSQDRKQQGELAGGSVGGRNIFGSVPEGIPYESVEYTPVDYRQVQMDTIHDQSSALPDINTLTANINAALRDDSATRINGWSPGFTKNLNTMGNNAGELLNGRLPFDDVLGIVTNRQELSNTLGTPGTSMNATLKDLGMSRLQAMQQGGDMMGRITQLAQSIDPIEQRSRPQDWMVTPGQTIPWKIGEQQFAAQLEAQQAMFKHGVDQNNAVLEATGDPTLVNNFGANYLQRMTNSGGSQQSNSDGGYAQLAAALGKAYQNNQAQNSNQGNYNGASYYGNNGYAAQQQYYQNNYGSGQAYSNTYGGGDSSGYYGDYATDAKYMTAG